MGLLDKMTTGIKEERAKNIAEREASEREETERASFSNKPEERKIQEIAIKAGKLAYGAAVQSGANLIGATGAEFGAIAQTAAGLVIDQERHHDGRVDQGKGLAL